jgi:hypothetical protein
VRIAIALRRKRRIWVFERLPAEYVSGVWNHTVPFGTDLFYTSSQAINCLATIIQSRDNFREAPSGQQIVITFHIFDPTSQNIFEDEDEDD